MYFACDRQKSTRRHPEFLGSCTSCTTRRHAQHHAYVSDPWLVTRTDACVYTYVQAVPTQALYRHVLVEWVFRTSLKRDCCDLDPNVSVVAEATCTGLLMALQTATASETFYGQVVSHVRFSVCNCRSFSYTLSGGKVIHEYPHDRPTPRPPLQWLPVGLGMEASRGLLKKGAPRWPPTPNVGSFEPL